MKKKKAKAGPRHFPSVSLAETNRRAGKHQRIVYQILSDLDRLDNSSAIRIDLVEVGEKRADLRAALHRAAKKAKVRLSTTSDEKHLYVFHPAPKIEKRAQVLLR
jgi:hypothetical protein